MNIHTYPAFNRPTTLDGNGTSAPDVGSRTAMPSDSRARVVDMSDHAAMTEDPTINANETSVRPETFPPNQRTSPYAYDRQLISTRVK
jgi:hypothetical protein